MQFVTKKTIRKTQQGFSLVEVMIGLTVGLITVLAVTQTLSVFESQRQISTTGADAESSGQYALTMITEDLRRAGSGFNNPNAFGCQNFHSYVDTGGGSTPGPVNSFSTTSVSIVGGAGSASDTLLIRTASQFTGSIPTIITIGDNTDRTVTVRRGYDIDVSSTQVMALLVMNDKSHCMLGAITSATTATASSTLTFGIGVSSPNPEYNVSNGYMTANGWPLFDAYINGQLFVLGKITSGAGITSRAYGVDANKQLFVSNYRTGASPASEVLANDIVSLQIQYGVALAGATARPATNTVAQWVEPVGAWATVLDSNGNMTTQPALADIQRIIAIRVVAVARASRRDAALVTTACTDNHATNYGPCAYVDDTSTEPAPAIDLRSAPGDTEWQHYRYKVFQTIVPLRNVMWSN